MQCYLLFIAYLLLIWRPYELTYFETMWQLTLLLLDISNRGGSRGAAPSKMERFMIIVTGFQPLTIITKRSNLDVAPALDASLLKIQNEVLDIFSFSEKGLYYISVCFSFFLPVVLVFIWRVLTIHKTGWEAREPYSFFSINTSSS